jgi:hypothetical protein
MPSILELARRVKKGAALLDKKFPSWRRVMRAHVDEFNFEDGDFCVLGTLEHHLGRAKVLAKRRREKLHLYALPDVSRYQKLVGALFGGDEAESAAHGFNAADDGESWESIYLGDLWQAEFESVK